MRSAEKTKRTGNAASSVCGMISTFIGIVLLLGTGCTTTPSPKPISGSSSAAVPVRPPAPQSQEVVQWAGHWRASLPEGGDLVVVFESSANEATESFWFGFLASDLPQEYWWVNFNKWKGVKGIPSGTRMLSIPTVTQTAEGHTTIHNDRNVRMLRTVEPIVKE